MNTATLRDDGNCWLPLRDASNWPATQRAPAPDPKPYMETLEASLGDLMSGETRPGPIYRPEFSDTVGEVHYSEPGQLDETHARHMPLQGQCRGGSCNQGRQPCAHPHLCLTDESMERVVAKLADGRRAVRVTSEPMPLEHDTVRKWDRIANIVVLGVLALLSIPALINLALRSLQP